MNLKKIIKDYKTFSGNGAYFEDDIINLFEENGFYGDFEMEEEIYFSNPDNWQVSLVWTKGDTFSVNGVNEHKTFKEPNEAIAYAKELAEKPIEKLYVAYSVEGAMFDKYRMRKIKESELEQAKKDIENFCLQQSEPCTYEIYESTEENPLGDDYPVWSFTNTKRVGDAVRRPAKSKMTRAQSKKANGDVTEKMKAAIRECYERTLPLFDNEFIFCDESNIEFSEDELSVEIPFDIPDLETSGSIVYYIYNETPLKTGEDSDIKVKASYYDEYGQNMFDYFSAAQGAPRGYQRDFSIDGAVTKVEEALESDKKEAMAQEY